jgi:ubiquinone/menaquinone biosynthesis C-methylase UbiE
MPSTRDPGGINVKIFEDVDDSDKLRSYIEILDKFDALPGIQALKKAAIERCGIQAGTSILDDGCGAGLETVRLARFVGSTGKVIGLDASQAFIAEARRRADGPGLPNEYLEGEAHRLPFQDDSFELSRAERLFLYLRDPVKERAELVRVTKSRGIVYLIEPTLRRSR